MLVCIEDPRHPCSTVWLQSCGAEAPTPAPTLDDDAKALLAFKDSLLNSNETSLASWTPRTAPCNSVTLNGASHNWLGVYCNGSRVAGM